MYRKSEGINQGGFNMAKIKADGYGSGDGSGDGYGDGSGYGSGYGSGAYEMSNE